MTLKVFIGYDQREAVAYHVLSHSIMRRASRPVSIQPIYLDQLGSNWWRARHPNQSTDFTFARFLTPWLSDYHGISVFMDCDMLCLDDIWKLHDLCKPDHYKDVFVVKHDYTPKTAAKFLSQPQSIYPCKNWSSLMVFNNHRARTRDLTPIYVNNSPPMDLHQFKWASDVGDLPERWNHLVGEYAPNPDVSLVHYTLGGPWFDAYRDCEYSSEWWEEYADMTHTAE